MKTTYQLVVIGGGAAGFSAVIAAADAGADVLLISDGPLGGTCVNYGCVPTKTLLYKLAETRLHGNQLQIQDLVKQAVNVSTMLRGEKYESLLDKLGIDYIQGRARFAGKQTIEVGGREIKFEKAVIAVGGKTWIPPIPGIQKASKYLLDNEKLFSDPPGIEKIVIIGGRAQGVEIAQIMARGGVDTTLIQRSPRLLPLEEPEVGTILKQVLENDGVKVYTGTKINRVEAGESDVSVYFEHDGDSLSVEADYIYLATGRKPRLEYLSPEKAGVKISSDGYIVVDEYLRASEHVYAAGDCINGFMLEPVAAKEGYTAALNALGGRYKIDYTIIPRAVFTDPEYARVGLTEEELSKKIGACACRLVKLRELPKAKILGREEGFAKMVIDPRNKRIVGFHIVSPYASEIIHEATLAIRAGMTIDDIIDTIHVFPTVSEIVKYTALAFYRDISKMPCCLV
ncbi:MAG: mercury(II) reductase [Desulfurococcales archaeon]|nr:mercury(II) reductase [Desulfurococcales archaeon]